MVILNWRWWIACIATGWIFLGRWVVWQGPENGFISAVIEAVLAMGFVYAIGVIMLAMSTRERALRPTGERATMFRLLFAGTCFLAALGAGIWGLVLIGADIYSLPNGSQTPDAMNPKGFGIVIGPFISVIAFLIVMKTLQFFLNQSSSDREAGI